jgi:hypothetical protein
LSTRKLSKVVTRINKNLSDQEEKESQVIIPLTQRVIVGTATATTIPNL